MTTKTIASRIIEEATTVEDARKQSISRMVDRLICGSETKIVYEFSDESLLVLDFDEQRMTAV